MERNTVIAALVVLLGLWLSMLMWGRGNLDRAIYKAVYAGDDPTLVAIGRAFTALGEPTISSRQASSSRWFSGFGAIVTCRSFSSRSRCSAAR